MAAISVTNTFTNGTAADATEVNQNFTDLVNGLGDGTKDITVSAVTANGAATLNGAVTLGNATGDDITVTGRVASHIDPKTASTYDLGDATQLWRAFYGNDIFCDRGAVGTPSHSFHEDTDTGAWSPGANIWALSTGGTERLRIDSTGTLIFNDSGVSTSDVRIESDNNDYMFFVDSSADKIGINISSPVSMVHIFGDTGVTPLVCRVSQTTGSGNDAITFRDGNDTDCGIIEVDADANTVSYGTSSDIRLKHKIEQFDALSMIGDFNPVMYERKKVKDVKEFGFIAQELVKVLPQAVTMPDKKLKDSGKYAMVDYGKLTGVLTRAVQQQQEQLKKLQEQLDQLLKS